MSPPRNTMSVPARIGTQMSASALVREKRGSTWMIVAPCSFAFITQRKPTGCASAMEEPSIKMQSALAKSCCAVVAPPAAEGGAQTGHRAAMSYPGLVGHTDHAEASG